LIYIIGNFMSHSWNKTYLDSEEKVFDVLSDLQGKQWLCRGQPKCYNKLTPLIDRKHLRKLSRIEKLKLERQSIDIFRSSVRFFADQGEQGALNNDITALVVLRNYGVPTRLLDWSKSPFVATFFAVCDFPEKDGEIWTFDESLYEQEGKKQWVNYPETTINRDGYSFYAKLTAFNVEEPNNWIVCLFHPPGIPRQNAQAGVYTFTPRFGSDHSEVIANLLADSSHSHLYIIRSHLKNSLLKDLREKHGIWRGSLFPDSAGSAESAGQVFKEEKLSGKSSV
jgi:hypothetical protein